MAIPEIRRLFIALALAAFALHAYPQADFVSEAPETEPDDVLQSPHSTSSAQAGKSAQIRDHLARAEAARRRGNLVAQIAQLRSAHAIAEGRDSGIVNLLAGALLQAGDRDGAQRLREDILATGLHPSEKLAHATALAVNAADIADIDTAGRWLASAESLARQLGGDDNVLLAQTRLHWARGALLLAAGKYREGEAEGRLAASALRQLGAGMGGRTSANLRYWQNLIDAQLASSVDRQGRTAESEWIYRGTLARSRRESGAGSLATARFALELAGAQLRQGRYEDALGEAAAALAALGQRQGGQSARVMANALLLIGWSEVMAGRFDRGMAAFERRAQTLGAAGNSVVWGYAMIRSGRAAAALPMLRASYETAMRRSATLYATRERAGMYAYALLRAGRADEAMPLFAAALPGLVNARQGRRATDRADMLLETISNWIIEGYFEALSPRAESGDSRAIAEMFRLADVARGSTVQRALSLASARARFDDPELAAIARREQDLGNVLAARGRILEELLVRQRGQAQHKAIANLNRDIQAATRERDNLRREIALRFPKYSQLIEPRPLSMAESLKLLKPGEVIVATYSAHDRTYAWAIPKSGPVRFTRSALGLAELASKVKTLRSALDVGDVPLAAFPAFDTATAYALYRQLLQPLEQAWGNADSLIVVPHGSLGQLPFALLPTAPAAIVNNAGFDAYRKVPWLIRRLAISQLPSVSALAALRPGTAASSVATLAFAGFGDPRFRAASSSAPATHRDLQVRNLRHDPQVVKPGEPAGAAPGYGVGRLPQLPDTALEVREIAAILKAASNDVLLGTDASETNVKARRLDQYRVLMFATHGLAPGDLEGLAQPALALSNPALTGERDADGLLTLDEVLGLKLAADWVVLSACNTAAGNGAGSEAVSGLGRGFFYAGARALLVSHWPVETVSARLITTDLFRRQSEDPSLTRGQALRQTLLNLIDRGEAKDAAGRVRFSYAHPMFWAPFSLIGDSG